MWVSFWVCDRNSPARLNGTIAIYGLVTLENAPQLVQNDPVVAENDHFDDRVLTEQHRPEQEEKVSGKKC